MAPPVAAPDVATPPGAEAPPPPLAADEVVAGEVVDVVGVAVEPAVGREFPSGGSAGRGKREREREGEGEGERKKLTNMCDIFYKFSVDIRLMVYTLSVLGCGCINTRSDENKSSYV